jgi:hypothetical protein
MRWGLLVAGITTTLGGLLLIPKSAKASVDAPGEARGLFSIFTRRKAIPPDILARHPKLAELQPDFGVKIAYIIARLESRGFQPIIKRDSGWRSEADQRRIKSAGHSGVSFSFHMATEGGQPAALAVDIVDRRWAWGDAAQRNGFWDALHEEAQVEGYHTGITWTNPWDPAHVQPWSKNSGMLAQVAAGNWSSRDLA